MPYKEALSTVAIVMTLIVFYPYIRSILRNEVKPHVFSWLIWTCTTFVVFLALLKEDGGAGAWPIGLSACITAFIAFLAYIKRTDIRITHSDWLFLILALSSLPLWYFTSDPLWAVIVLTIVDVLGFGPTIRKAYHLPYSESLLFFGLYIVRDLIVIMALENYSVTTVLFPAAISVTVIFLMLLMVHRRRVLALT